MPSAAFADGCPENRHSNHSVDTASGTVLIVVAALWPIRHLTTLEQAPVTTTGMTNADVETVGDAQSTDAPPESDKAPTEVSGSSETGTKAF